jgi:beta-mannanase
VDGSQYGYGNPPWDMRSQDAFEAHAGKKASLMAIGVAWGSSTPNFQPAAMDTIRNRGSIPFVSWQPDVPGAGVNQPDYQLSDISSGRYDGYITSFAQAAKAWGHPFFLRFAWEMNGNWFPWAEAVNGNQPGQYVQAWRHVHDIFNSVGASNVTWVWCPNIDWPGSGFPALGGLYPGDAYVDWTCLDVYNTGYGGYWHSFDQLARGTYNLITGTLAPSKPVVIAETASTEQGGSKAAWISDLLGTQLPQNYPRIKALLWFNWALAGDWPIETSASAQSAFATGIASSRYAANSFASLGGSVIQPLGP